MSFSNEATSTYLADAMLQLSFAIGDARFFDFNEQFDIVFSKSTLHWVDDHQAFFHCAAKALRPTGKLIVSCGGQGNAAAILATLAIITSRPEWQRYFQSHENPYHFHGVPEYSGWLMEAGLQKVRLELVAKDMTHLGSEGLAGWIQTPACASRG